MSQPPSPGNPPPDTPSAQPSGPPADASPDSQPPPPPGHPSAPPPGYPYQPQSWGPPADPRPGYQPPPPPGHPSAPPPGYPSQPPPGYPSQPPGDQANPFPGQPPAPPRKKRRGLLIAIIALAVSLVLCGGVGLAAYLTFRASEGAGAETPTEAVTRFLEAIFVDNDATEAGKVVCRAARDRPALVKRLKEIEESDLKYRSPRYTWEPPKAVSEEPTKVTLTTTVKLTTADDRVAEQVLSFVTIKDNGWWVCDIGGGT
ncbi:MAG TPA: hypothetical protein VK453_07905 [Micromonosporaceae bacterium]|nr:hypothetical protein [Micromonosporaceae bacterium]